MTGPKLIAMILFGVLSFFFALMFSVGLNGMGAALVVGLLMAALTCGFIYFATTGRHAFARGFLGLGAVCIIVPIAALSGFGEQVAEGTLPALQTNGALSEEEASIFVVSSIVASAGVVFGMIIGLIFVVIGGLMHLNSTKTATPD